MVRPSPLNCLIRSSFRTNKLTRSAFLLLPLVAKPYFSFSVSFPALQTIPVFAGELHHRLILSWLGDDLTPSCRPVERREGEGARDRPSERYRKPLPTSTRLNIRSWSRRNLAVKEVPRAWGVCREKCPADESPDIRYLTVLPLSSPIGSTFILRRLTKCL